MPAWFLVYSPRDDLSLYGLERLHPFDAKKFSRARRRIEQNISDSLAHHGLEPFAPATDAELLPVHSADHLPRLADSAVVAHGVVARDWLVIDALIERRIPMVAVTSGGYTDLSHELIVPSSGSGYPGIPCCWNPSLFHQHESCGHIHQLERGVRI